MNYKNIKISEKTINGYNYFYDPSHPLSNKSGIVYLHRHIASLKIGRWLNQDEIVHHIDEDRSNNSEDNLLICNSHKEHIGNHKNLKEEIQCKICKKKTKNKSTCSLICENKRRRKNIPNMDSLKLDIENMSWSNIGRKYKVSPTSVRKWAKRYKLI